MVRKPAGAASDLYPIPADASSSAFVPARPAMHLSPRLTRLLLPCLMAFSLLAGLGLRQPSPPDEPRFVLAARTMVQTGQWLVPHRGSEMYAEKPPVFMWLQAATWELVRSWPVAFLLPSLLAALLTLWLVRDLGRRLWNRRAGDMAALALFACLQFGLMAKRAQIDMVVLAMITLSLWALLRHLLQGPWRPGLALAGFAAGLGTVTKGVGFLPLLALVPWALWRWRARPALPRTGAGGWLLLAGGFLAGTGVWLVPLGLALVHAPSAHLQAYAQELLFRQTGTRYVSAWHHLKPAWYYLKVMAALWQPGVLLAPWLLPAWWHRLRRLDGRIWVLVGWALLVLAFFSASPGKREVYILPMLPALCVAAGPLLAALLRRRPVRWLLAGYVALVALAALVLGAQALGGHGTVAKGIAARGMDLAIAPAVGAWLMALGLGGLAILAWTRLRRAGLATVLFAAWLWCIYGVGLAPALDPYASAARLMQRVGRYIGPDAQLGMVAWREQNLLQADRPAVDFGFKAGWEQQWRAAAPWLLADPQRRWLFVLDQALDPCVDRAATVDAGVSNRNHWRLVPARAWRPGCRAGAAPAGGDDGSEDEEDD